jgi:hypothetical protein
MLRGEDAKAVGGAVEGCDLACALDKGWTRAGEQGIAGEHRRAGVRTPTPPLLLLPPRFLRARRSGKVVGLCSCMPTLPSPATCSRFSSSISETPPRCLRIVDIEGDNVRLGGTRIATAFRAARCLTLRHGGLYMSLSPLRDGHWYQLDWQSSTMHASFPDRRQTRMFWLWWRNF